MAETLPALPLDVMEIGERAAQFARSSRAPPTERAYQYDWSDFVGWCRQAGVVATLNRRVAAITAAHRMAGQGFDASHPAIANVLAGIRRAYGTRQDAKTALLTKVEHDRLFGQSVSHQLFSSDGKRCTVGGCRPARSRISLAFRPEFAFWVDYIALPRRSAAAPSRLWTAGCSTSRRTGPVCWRAPARARAAVRSGGCW